MIAQKLGRVISGLVEDKSDHEFLEWSRAGGAPWVPVERWLRAYQGQVPV